MSAPIRGSWLRIAPDKSIHIWPRDYTAGSRWIDPYPPHWSEGREPVAETWWVAACTRCLDAVETRRREEATAWRARHAATRCRRRTILREKPAAAGMPRRPIAARRGGVPAEWEQWEDDLLAAQPPRSAKELAAMLGRSVDAIYGRKRLIGATTLTTRWTQEEDDILRECRGQGMRVAQQRLPGRTVYAIRSRVRDLGISLGRRGRRTS